MKKRTLTLLLALAMSFTLLTACGGKDSGSADTPSDTEVQDPAFSADLTAFYQSIMDAAGEAPAMMDMTEVPEMLEIAYPGLSELELKQCVVYSPAISSIAMEFAFVEAASAADAETVRGIFQNRIDTQVAGGAWYPETIDGWQNNSEIVVIDNYVCLFVCPEKDGMVEAFRTGSDVPAWGEPSAPVEDEAAMGEVVELPDAELPDETVTVTPAAETSAAPSAKPSSKPSVQPTPAPSAPASAGVDLAAFYADVYADLFPADANGDPTGPAAEDMAAVDGMLDNFYAGLSAISTKQCHVYMPMISAVPFEIALVEVADAADVDAVKAILQARIDNEVANQYNYPMVIENWELNSRVVVHGNYLMMVAHEQCDAFVSAFDALF